MSDNSSARFMSGVPTPPSTASLSAASRRGRRAERSSSDESVMGAFDISNVYFRVMTPPRPNPLVSYDMTDECRQVLNTFGTAFEDMARLLASTAGIPESKVDVRLTSRVFRDDASDYQTAVLIVVDDWTSSSPQVWEAVVVEVKKYIDTKIAEEDHMAAMDISVEMVHANLMRRKYLSPLARDDTYPKLDAAWPKLRRGIFNILQEFSSTKDRMTFIVLSRIGFNPNYMNPNTVYIAVDYGSSEIGWPPVLEKMQAFVDEFHLGLQLLMEHNEIRHSAFQTLPVQLTAAEINEKAKSFNFEHERPYTTVIPAGADIGASTYHKRDDNQLVNPLVGTLGCWIEINVKGKGWQTMGLTNYHVVRPTLEGYTVRSRKVEVTTGQPMTIRSTTGRPIKDSKLWKADREGLSPKGAPERCAMEHPARAKHNFTVHQIQARISDYVKSQMPVPAQLRAELADITSFFDHDQQSFGLPYFASGYLKRTGNNGRLDWALIQPMSNDHIGGNRLPSDKDWFAGGYAMAEAPLALDGTLNSQQNKIGSFGPEDCVFKTGASTKSTVGQYNGLKADSVISEERYMTERSDGSFKSQEHVFIGLRNMEFANKGDSGAVVWDKCGGIVGLLFRGLLPQQAGPQGYTLVTPIEDVVQSIIEESKGNILGVRILGAAV